MEWLLGAGWLIYGALHSLLASRTAKKLAQAILGRHFRLYRLLYSMLALGLLVPPIWILVTHRSALVWTPSPLQICMGIVVTMAGMWLSAAVLKRYIQTPSGFRDLFLEGEKPPLQTHGFHQQVRHPLYLSTFLFVWGIFLVKPSYAILITDLSITLYTLIAIRWEEMKLVHTYGDAYIRYQKEVPKIIPKWK